MWDKFPNYAAQNIYEIYYTMRNCEEPSSNNEELYGI